MLVISTYVMNIFRNNSSNFSAQDIPSSADKALTQDTEVIVIINVSIGLVKGT